ncbi:MAG TPA: HAMP domain-containing sensor histidine kinase [Baekduia sp.]
MRSLRGRLTLGVLLVLAAVIVAAGAAALREVDKSERSALDDRLRRTAELTRPAAIAEVQNGLPSSDPRLNAVLRATGSSVRLVLGRVPLVDAGVTPPAHGPLPTGLSTFTSGGHRYRAYVTTLDDPDIGGRARLQVVSALSGTERRIDDLRERIVLIGVAGLVASGILVWLIASVLLRPLRRLREVTASIADDEDLGRRVPDASGPRELRSVARSFNAMLARLGRSAQDRERALAATRRFAADAGHELRTPLTSVQATLSALRRHPDIDAERRGALLDDALVQQRRLVDLLDGLQALARGEAGPIEHAPVDLTELVDEVVTAAGARQPDVRIEAVLPEAPVVVDGWEPGLRLVVENLVTNAIRHGGARVRVTLEGDGPALVVDDDGPGVPDDQRERIFAPFARIDGTDTPGSGLGLALVAQQAGHHGARVEVDRGPLGGARFAVRFGN